MRARVRRTATAATAAVMVAIPLWVAAPAVAAEDVDPVATAPVFAGSVRSADGATDFLPLVDVEVAGKTLRMLLDTGSPDLVVYPGVLDDAPVPPVITDAVADLHYDGADIDGVVAIADVAVAGVPALEPVPFVLAETCTPETCLGGEGVQGILGVSQGFNEFTAGDGTTYVTYTPLAQLPAPASNGYSVQLDAPGTVDGERIGTLGLGVRLIAGDGVTTLRAESTGELYPNRQNVYAKSVSLCVTIADVEKCHLTTIDSGERASVLFGAEFRPWAEYDPNPTPWPGEPGVLEYGPIRAGTAVAYGAADADAPFWTRTVGPAYRGMNLYEDAAGAQPFNTGNLFFIGRSVVFDRVDGVVVVGPVSGLPPAPVDVEASAADRRLDVAWQPGAADPTVESFVVRLRDVAGRIVAEQTLPAAARSATFADLVNGAAYRAEVAAANPRGLGPWAASAEVLVGPTGPAPARLPETGPGDALGGMLATAMLLGAGLTLMGVAASRRTTRELRRSAHRV